MSNVSSSLPRRSRGTGMVGYDQLPPAARAWVAQAVLPWSARSVARIWRAGVAEGGEAAALQRLTRAEHRMLARDKKSPRSGRA